MPEEIRADLLLGRDTLSPGMVKAGRAAADASSNVRQLTRDLYEVSKQRATPVVDLNDAAATAKLGEVSAKLKELGARVADPKVDLEDKKALASVATMRVRLDELGKKVSSPRVTLEGLARAEAKLLTLDAQLDALDGRTVDVTVDVDRHRGIFSRLGGLFGGIGGGGGPTGLGTGIAGLGQGGPLALGIGAALAAALAPALIPFGIGGLAGGGAAAGAFAIGKRQNEQLQKLNRQLASARGAQRKAIQAQIRQIQRSSAPELGIFSAFQDVGTGALGAFTTGLKAQGPGGAPSFLTGLTGILKQIGGFIDKIGPQLGGLFRASLPSLSAFVKIFEQFAKAVLPAMTQSLQALEPSLPTLVQGFKYLSEGIADFIKNLGPGIKDAAIIFKAAMLVVKGFLQLIGVAASDLATGIVK